MKTKYMFVIIISLGIFIFSAKKIYDKIENYLYNIKPNIVSISPRETNSSQQQVQLQDNEALKNNLSEINKENQQNKTTNEEQQNISSPSATSKNFKVVLKYENKKAKSVKLSGSFYAWKERDMKKKKGAVGVWEEEIVLTDKGIYKYYFIVDGKKVLDPGANKTLDGKYSLLEVK